MYGTGRLKCPGGKCTDFISNDEADSFINHADWYTSDYFNNRRHSKDNTLNKFVKSLINLCCEMNMHILNGRGKGDEDGEITFVSAQGKSVIDYVIVETELYSYCGHFQIIDYDSCSHFPISVYDATRCTPVYRCTPGYRVICSATWWIRRQFALQKVPTLKNVLPIVLSDENAPKTRIFCKIRTFHICFCPGADPGFEKGGTAVASGARSQDFFGQFRGLFKEFRAKRGGRVPPPLDPRLLPSFKIILHFLIPRVQPWKIN